uniref:HECT domain-containing protein n=1 Tax=Magallana gigas TaxID=29159 RepID=A0A8W8J7A0_MAGGI
MRNGESIGFPQLQNSGGFELLNCKQNCRELTLINCHWNVRSLKSYIGNQAKIYIRPIQTSLDTTPKDQGEILTDAKVSCKACHCLFSVRELRAHIQTCMGGKSICENELLAQDLDSDDLPDPEIGRQGQLPVINPTQSFIPLQTTDQDVNLNNTVLYFNPPFVFIPENETQPQMSTECIVPSIDRNSSTLIMKEDESNLPAASWTNGTGTLDDQSQNVSSRPLQAFLALQQSTTNSLDVTSAASCITSVEATVCANAHEPVFLSPESASEEKRQEDQTIEAVIATAIEYCLNLRTTLEVQFYDETAEDLGGPRKEFFQLVLSEIKRKYFDSGLREHLAKDYLTVGKIMSLSVLQNGKLPKFMDPAILEDVFRDEDGSSDCIKNLRKGLNCLGLVKIGSVFPIFVHLFRPSQTTLTLKAVIQILKPVFSEEGSNSRQLENSVYSAYLKYLRAVASGRRGSVSLHHILQFATGTPEEPILGFTLQPSIHFFEVKSSSGFIPTANTCINNMKLPRPSYEIALPSEEELFALKSSICSNLFKIYPGKKQSVLHQ